MLVNPADRLPSARKLHGNGCEHCCQPTTSVWGVSRSLDHGKKSDDDADSPTSVNVQLRSSGPPRFRCRTPEKQTASLARSLPIAAREERPASAPKA